MSNEFWDSRSVVSHPGISLEASAKAYTNWSKTYEEELSYVDYKGPRLAAEYLSESIPEDVRGSARILDVGAGTGLVAKELKARGFQHIDALDPSVSMLEEARKRNYYDNYITEYITKEPLTIPADTYDGLTGCGIYAEGGHLPVDALYEMVRLVKPGGFVVLVTRAMLLDPSISDTNKDLEPLMRKFEAEGKWRLLRRDVGTAKFYSDVDAVVWKYQVL